MTIYQITYRYPTSSTGDTSEAAEGYRAWLKRRLQEEFPGVAVLVTDEESSTRLRVQADEFDEFDRVREFVKHVRDEA